MQGIDRVKSFKKKHPKNISNTRPMLFNIYDHGPVTTNSIKKNINMNS